MPDIPFIRSYTTGSELARIQDAIDGGELSGNGAFARRCTDWLEGSTACRSAMLTHSGTGALEIAALLAEVGPGDEVIMPSFTFVSTANAFVLRGAVPVFVEIRPDTLNLDESRLEDAVTPRTKVIVPVHYGGVACEMDAIMDIAERRGLLVVEDAAHAYAAGYRGRPLGSIGQLAALSFHDTKNVTCGEGGALLINDEHFAARAEVVQEKGTTRTAFFRGEVDKYRWVDIGSSYPPSEISAAFLWSQLQSSEWITEQRMNVWRGYHEAFAGLEAEGKARRPVVPGECRHNAHLYYLLVSGADRRDALIEHLESRGVQAVFHYVPLHSAPAGRKYGRTHGDLDLTRRVSEGLVRLPMWVGMGEEEIGQVVDAVYEGLGSAPPTSVVEAVAR